ncbi:MAG: carboxymuconolactone decarboxylase family protein [Blastocatellia bacterium]
MCRKNGITEEQLENLQSYQNSAAFSQLEKLVLDYAVAVTNTPVEVTDELMDRLKLHFDEAQLVELTASISWENFRARFNHAFGIESQEFSRGAYCPLPENRAAAHSRT